MRLQKTAKNFRFALFVLDFRQSTIVSEFTIFYCVVSFLGLTIYLPHIAYIPRMKRLFHAHFDVCKYGVTEGVHQIKNAKVTTHSFVIFDAIISIAGLLVRVFSVDFKIKKETALPNQPPVNPSREIFLREKEKS